MRKLLQNNAVVASLAVVAILCVAGNFIRWPKSGGLTIAARAPLAVNPASSSDFPERTAYSVEQAFVDWQVWRAKTDPAAGRDPFGPVLIRSTTAPVAKTNTISKAVAPLFVVQATSIEPGKAFAVVNRRVVSPGDQLEGYVVEQIISGQVRLRGPAGLVTVSIGTTRTPAGKTTSAK